MSFSIVSMPENGRALDSFVDGLLTRLRSRPEDYPIDADRLAGVEEQLARWRASRDAVDALRSDLATATRDRRRGEARLRRTIGALMRMVVFDDALSARARSESGMIVETDPTPAGPIESSPRMTVESTDRMRHVIAFRDDGYAGYRVWPAGASSIEIVRSIGGEAPNDPSAYAPLPPATARRATYTFAADQIGSPVHYLARYLDRTGRPGPWSTVLTTTVPVA